MNDISAFPGFISLNEIPKSIILNDNTFKYLFMELK